MQKKEKQGKILKNGLRKWRLKGIMQFLANKGKQILKISPKFLQTGPNNHNYR